MTDSIEYRVGRGLMALAQAGESEDWSEGSADEHVAQEAYLEALWRFRSIDLEDTDD